MYYLQSRYYDPEVCRFINADSYASTGQGFIGHNMFAYCNNNPSIYKDDNGTVITVAIVGAAGAAISLFDLCASFFVIYLLYEVASSVASIFSKSTFQEPSTYDSVSSNIDWNSGDKNHILKGTNNKHVSGWGRLGINPNNNNNWNKLLPILKDVVDNADDYWEEILKTGDRLLFYSKTYVEEGVKVIVKIWSSADGLI